MARLYALQLADQRAMEKQGVRENPVRRNGYALQGGASGEAQQIKNAIAQLQDQQHNATSVQRTMNDRAIKHLTEQLEHLEGGAMCGGSGPDVERFQLASERAEEIQANRTNPRRKGATPTMGVSRVRGGTHTDAHYEHDREGKLLHETMEAHEAEGRAMKRGGRAVPSSGLSQFRGGGSDGVIVGGGKHCDDSDSDMEGGGRDSEILARESASRPVIRAGLSDEHSVEAKEMGRHLGRHLMTMRGGGFFDLFTKGIVEAGRENADVSKVTGMPNPSPPPMAPPASGGALFHRRRDMLDDTQEAHEEHTARRFGRVRKGAGVFSNTAPMRQYEQPTTDMGLKPKKRSNNDLHKPYMPSSERKPSSEINIGSIKPSWMKGGYLSGQYEGMGGSMSGGVMVDLNGNDVIQKSSSPRISFDDIRSGRVRPNFNLQEQNRVSSKGGTRSETKPKRKEKNPYKRTHTSEMSLGKMKKVKKPAPPPPAEQPDVGLALDLPPPPPVGRGKARRSPAGPNDGRRKRAEIVKKVMAEKGMKMIEASKYVKAHNLY